MLFTFSGNPITSCQQRVMAVYTCIHMNHNYVSCDHCDWISPCGCQHATACFKAQSKIYKLLSNSYLHFNPATKNQILIAVYSMVITYQNTLIYIITLI